MADVILIPTSTLVVDDRKGNSFIIMEVRHTNGDDSRIIVPDSAVSVAELGDSNTAAPTLTAIAGSVAGLINPTSNQMAVENAEAGDSIDSGMQFGNFIIGDGVKQVHIDTGSTTGTYILVVRCIGNAAGAGSTNSADL